ncbi:MAG: hypothetical protein ACUVWP_02060 [bacterium]
MIRRILIFTVIITLTLTISFCHGWQGSPGGFLPHLWFTTAGISATGGITSTVGGLYSLFANPAGTDLGAEKGIIASYCHPFSKMGGSSIASIGLSTPMKLMYGSLGTIGITGEYFSSGKMAGYRYSKYTYDFEVVSTVFSLSWSKGLGASIEFEKPPSSFIGFKMRIYTLKVSYLSDSGFGIDAGFIKPLPKVRIGFFLKNIVSPNIELKNISDSEPFMVVCGIALNPFSKFWLSGDFSIDIDRRFSGAVGGKYRIGSEKLSVKLMAGYDTDSDQPTMGIGFRRGAFEINTSFLYHCRLGLTTTADLVYNF